MEQGREEEDMKRRQDHDHQQQQRRLKPPAAGRPENQLHQHHHQPQQPQKCPRCDSLNTKFCYYNNYSLSQPRYFCKACRRYWTHGGTLRNVPVGGGCRKGKRAKHAPSSSSSGGGGGGENTENTILPSTLAAPPPRELHVPQNIATNSGNLVIPPMGSYYLGGGFLSSVAAMQSLSQTQPFNQQLNASSAPFGGSPNLGFLQGLNLPPFSSQQAQNRQIQQQNEFYQMGNREKSIESLYPPDQNLVQANRPLISPWNQTLISRSTTTTNTNDNPTTSNPNFTSSTPGTTMNPNQWPDLPGYGHPP